MIHTSEIAETSLALTESFVLLAVRPFSCNDMLKSTEMLHVHVSIILNFRTNETFLAFHKDERSTIVEEHILSFDEEEKSLVEIDLLSGRTHCRYCMGKVSLVILRYFW